MTIADIYKVNKVTLFDWWTGNDFEHLIGEEVIHVKTNIPSGFESEIFSNSLIQYKLLLKSGYKIDFYQNDLFVDMGNISKLTEFPNLSCLNKQGKIVNIEVNYLNNVTSLQSFELIIQFESGKKLKLSGKDGCWINDMGYAMNGFYVKVCPYIL